MKVIKVVEGVRIVVKVGIFTTLAVLVLTGVLPTNGSNSGIGIF